MTESEWMHYGWIWRSFSQWSVASLGCQRKWLICVGAAGLKPNGKWYLTPAPAACAAVGAASGEIKNHPPWCPGRRSLRASGTPSRLHSHQLKQTTGLTSVVLLYITGVTVAMLSHAKVSHLMLMTKIPNVPWTPTKMIGSWRVCTCTKHFIRRNYLAVRSCLVFLLVL